MVLGAYLAGHEIVGDCMADDTMRAYMSQALFNEIMPTLDLPKGRPRGVRIRDF